MFLQMIDNADPCSLSFLILLLATIGQRSITEDRLLRNWGLRAAALTFLAYGGLRFYDSRPSNAGECLELIVKSLAAGALLLGPTWIFLGVAAFLFREAIPALFRLVSRLAPSRPTTADDTTGETSSPESPVDDSQASVDQSAAEEAAMQQTTDANKRRADARVACELLYRLYSHDIGERFPKEYFDDFVQRYLGNEHAPELVEERAGQLRETIKQHYEQINPPDKFTDLQQLARWYTKHKQEIERLDVDQSYKDDYLIQLNELYSHLTQRLLEKLEP